MKDINTVIFDLDGTLLDTLGDLTDAVNYALAERGYPTRTYDEVRNFVGNGIALLMQRTVPNGTSLEDAEKALAIFRAYYSAHNLIKTCAYENVNKMLDALLERGYRLAVVTNKFEAAAKDLVKEFFGDRIAVTVGENEAMGRRKKPAPDGVFAAMELLGATPAECVYVGDSDVDIDTANNAGIPCIGCSWGFRGREALLALGLDDKLVIDTPMDILDVLQQ